MRSGLSKKILFPTLGIIALGLLAVLVGQHLNARSIIRQELTKRLDREVQLTAKLIDSWLQARVTDIVAWSRQEVLAEALTEGGYYGRSARTGAEALFASLKTGYPQYESLFLANPLGEIIAVSPQASQPAKPVHLADRPYFQEAARGKAVISDVIVSRLSTHKTFTVVAPVFVNGEVVGVLGGVVDFAIFKTLFLEDFKIKQYGYAFVVDNHLQVLGSSQDNESVLSEAASAEFLHRILAGASGMFTHQMKSAEMLTVFQHLQRTDWAFVINQSLDDTLRPLDRIMQFSTAGALVVLLLVSLALAVLFHRLIVARLQAMLRIIGSVGAGDLSQRLPHVSVKPDEITELTDSFNAMIEQLDHTMTDLNGEIQVRRETEAALAHHQENLEKIIEQRGAELKKEVLERQRAEDRLIRARKAGDDRHPGRRRGPRPQ